MSVAWSRYIRENFRDWDLSPNARSLVDTLGNYGNSDGFAWPSDDELIARTGRSLTWVKRARREIRDAGVLIVSPGNGRRHATLYALPEAALKGVTGDPLPPEKGGHQRTERGSFPQGKGVAGDPPSTNRRSIGSARADWCDETCPLCAGVGWIERRAANGDPTNFAEPCPNRP